MDRLAIAQQRKKEREVVLPFVPCLRQSGDPAIPQNMDFWAIKDQVIWPKRTAKVEPRDVPFVVENVIIVIQFIISFWGCQSIKLLK